MKEWINYLFAAFAVIVVLGAIGTYTMAWLQFGTESKFKWWHWILVGFVLAVIFTVPSGDGCGPWWRSC